MTEIIDIHNIVDSQEEKTRKKLARQHRKNLKLMAKKNNNDLLFNI